MPSVRQLAGDLGLAPGTVARAYSELEAERILTTRQRGGTFIAAGRPRVRAPTARGSAHWLPRRRPSSRRPGIWVSATKQPRLPSGKR